MPGHRQAPKRACIVLENDQYGVTRRINPKCKAVYLVFTAHYSTNDNGHFENFDGIVPVLDVLKEKKVRGSFFPTGLCFDQPQYKAAIKRIVDEGHYLSAHSYGHLLMCEGEKSLVTRDRQRHQAHGKETGRSWAQEKPILLDDTAL